LADHAQAERVVAQMLSALARYEDALDLIATRHPTDRRSDSLFAEARQAADQLTLLGGELDSYWPPDADGGRDADGASEALLAATAQFGERAERCAKKSDTLAERLRSAGQGARAELVTVRVTKRAGLGYRSAGERTGRLVDTER
jgi:hypothetical protein